jgi:hypothetical protein
MAYPLDKDRAISAVRSSTAFATALDNRNRFRGIRRCVICGIGLALHRCHTVIGQLEEETVSIKVMLSSLGS